MAPGFGGYRPIRGYGVGKIGGAGTAIIVATVMAIAISSQFSLMLMVWLILLAVPVLALTVVPFGGSERTAVGHLAWEWKSWRGNAANTDAFSSDVLTEVPGNDHLPGVLAPLQPVTVDDGLGGKQCLVWNRRTGIVSAFLRVSPVGITLADEADAIAWMNGYGAWLADLGYRPMISSIVFTVESSPTGGVNQREYVLDRIEDDAPEVATRIMRNLALASRSSTADVSTVVTINFDLSKASPEPQTLLEGAAEVVRWLPGIESSLAASGATVTGRATTPFLIRRIRAAFDPAIRMFLAEGDSEEDELIAWRDAGPIRTDGNKKTDVYKHDSGYSVSWVLRSVPNGIVRQNVLLPLVSPGKYYRRFSMVYRPFSAAQASEIVEKEIAGGTLRRIFNSKTKKDETQRDHDDRVRSRKAAQEESLGAGLGQFTMYVTTTVRNEATLAAACADVEERCGNTKFRFRRARGAQEATFAASLGLGIDPTSALSRNANTRWLG
ncbi:MULTISPECIES: SCO6880 family protein [Rhodococcus]|uniref:PrgI family protein n=1 Tax=Rhodococcus qingshengii TaxID=334542 RepID=A0A2A5J4P1_RHOSG|nr:MULTISPECIES: SCO6880 family protein [Rhodococcus]PCK24326.1 hypothetical protein CHR55_26430 [Rhodococcus qingshengii]